jgi:hypothetical protein
MTILEKRISQLTTILQAWNELEEGSQKKSINFISEFILSASLLQKFSGDENLKTQLTSFQENYKNIFGSDLTKLGTSDLSPENVEILNKIKQIDDEKIERSTKREKISSFLEQKDKSIQTFRKSLITESMDKYPNAHVKISWNYGNFIDHIGQNLSPEKKEEFEKLKTELATTEDDQEFYKKLALLNQIADIPANFDKLKTKFGVDGIEEHSLINQGTQYRANLDVIRLITEIENQNGNDLFKKSQDFFKDKSELKSIKIDTKKMLEDSRPEGESKKRKHKEAESLQLTLGFEVECIILPTGGPKAQAKRKEEFSEFEQIKRGLVDNDSRKKMRETAGFDSSGIGSSPNTLLLFSDTELDQFKTQNLEKYRDKISAIEQYLEAEKQNYPQEIVKFDKALGNLALLSAEEIFFLDLFYLKKEVATKRRLTMDDVFDWRDEKEEQQKKFLKILEDIGEKGSFYAKTLDMIRASEFAIGEFPLETAKQEFDASLNHVRAVAKEHNLRLKDRGVQINVGAKLGQKTLNISSEKNGEELEIFTNPLTIAIGTAIQKALAKTFEDHPILQRKGQDIFGIEIKVDRKKGLINQTKGTIFFISFDPQKSREENSGLTTDSSPFHVHRQNTGKSVTIRFARIGEDGNEAVFEVRLLGNNPHSPFFDEYPRQIFNGAQPTVEIFIKNLTDNLKDLEILNEEQKIAIKNDGKIESIEVIYHEEKGNYPDTKITKAYAEAAQSREALLNAREN